MAQFDEKGAEAKDQGEEEKEGTRKEAKTTYSVLRRKGAGLREAWRGKNEGLVRMTARVAQVTRCWQETCKRTAITSFVGHLPCPFHTGLPCVFRSAPSITGPQGGLAVIISGIELTMRKTTRFGRGKGAAVFAGATVRIVPAVPDLLAPRCEKNGEVLSRSGNVLAGRVGAVHQS